MSNYQAIATVTAAISDILAGVKNDVRSTEVTTKHPDVIGVEATNRVNLFKLLQMVDLKSGKHRIKDLY